MKCPICQTELAPFQEGSPTIMQCPQPCLAEGGDHMYQRNTKDGNLVESYVYQGYMAITSPDHPSMHIPLTSLYLDTTQPVDHPVHEVEAHLSFPEIQQVIQSLEQSKLN